MALELSETMPASIPVGTSAKWKVKVPDYPPSDGYTLSVVFRGNASGASFSATCSTSAQGDFFEAYLSPATTSGKASGDYAWQSFVTDGTDTVLVDSGWLKLTPSLTAQSAPFDGRSPTKITLDAIQAAIQAKLTGDQALIKAYAIGDRNLAYLDMKELLELQSKYERLYAQELLSERVQKGLPKFKKIETRFS